MSLNSDCKETEENVPLHQEMGQLQLSYSLQQLIRFAVVSWLVLLSLTYKSFRLIKGESESQNLY